MREMMWYADLNRSDSGFICRRPNKRARSSPTTRSITSAHKPKGAHGLHQRSPAPDNPPAVVDEDGARPPRPLSGGIPSTGVRSALATSSRVQSLFVRPPLQRCGSAGLDSDRSRLVRRRAASPCPPRSHSALSTVIRNRVNLNRWSTTTSWGSGVGHRQTRASLDGVRGAGVKAVSPAKAGAERSDAP